MSEPVTIVVLTEQGLRVAELLRETLPNTRIDGLRRRTAASGVDRPFDQAGEHLRALFMSGTPIVGICAAGILIRLLASLLRDKTQEPPVIAVAEDGSAVVPLLGGHHGANRLAADIAAALHTRPAITTASDARLEVALDAPPPGWALANPENYKAFVAALLDGQPCRLEQRSPCTADWLFESNIDFRDDGPLTIAVSDAPQPADHRTLVYHPQRFALGVGCERGTPAPELQDLVDDALKQADVAPGALAGVFSLDLKCDEASVHELAASLGRQARFFAAPTLEALTPRLENPSEVVFAEVGCHGVAEAAALAAAGRAGVLTLPKRKSRRATCAIAASPSPIDPVLPGRPQGKLTVVGLGPGDPGNLTPEAGVALTAAADLVGYSGYLDMVPAREDQRRHPYPLGEETARVEHALALAAGGQNVALVCSGDPGVYAMASLVFERIETLNRPHWHRIKIAVLPGVSAMHAAAARAGAPLGHDFCAISLSDLLTPWTFIERRLRAAAEADFVIALYNPASMRRRRPLDQALDILRRHRRPDTPVVIGRQIGRPEERVDITTLASLDPDSVDMLTVLIIGSRESRTVRTSSARRMYTPRGYAGKCTDTAAQ